jgi:hypothetical protein
MGAYAMNRASGRQFQFHVPARAGSAVLPPNKKANQRMLIGLDAFNDGAPGEIRTPDPQVRSLVLYPAELRAHMKQKRNFAGLPAASSIDSTHSTDFPPVARMGGAGSRESIRGLFWNWRRLRDSNPRWSF